MIARIWHGIIAVVVVAALVLQVVTVVRLTGSPPVLIPGVVRGTSLPDRLIRVVSFFTIESNILSGVVSAQLAINPARDGRAWRAVRLAALIGITTTGIVYLTVLAPVHHPVGADEIIGNALVHYVSPVMMVLGWLLFGPRPRIDGRTVAGALLFPVLWAIYTFIRGALWSWYPYPFLDVTTHGYARVAVNALLVVLVLAVLCVLFWLGDRLLPGRGSATGPVTRVTIPPTATEHRQP